MRFRFPSLPGEFEIPDDWLDQSRFAVFRPSGVCYSCLDTSAEIIEIVNICPPLRKPGVWLDFNGFDAERTKNILYGMTANEKLPPVELIVIPNYDAFYRPYQYGLINGFHRYFCSLALGYSALPAVVREPFQ